MPHLETSWFCQTTQEKNIPPQICHYFLWLLLLLLLVDMLSSSCSRRFALGSSGEELIAQTSTGVPKVVLTCGFQFLFQHICMRQHENPFQQCFPLHFVFLSDNRHKPFIVVYGERAAAWMTQAVCRHCVPLTHILTWERGFLRKWALPVWALQK